MSHKKNSLMPGVFLIVFGGYLLASRFGYDHLFEDLYPAIMMLGGLLLIADTFRTRSQRSAFWGVALLVSGIFFMARNQEWIMYLYADEYWPIFPFAIGLGFVAKFLVKPKDWSVLIPAAILLMVSISSYVYIMDIWDVDWSRVWQIFWPSLLIFAGIGIFIRSFRRLPTDNTEHSE